MSTAVDIDVAALVGGMDAVPCESLGHGRRPDSHDGGPATHYVRAVCPNCGYNAVHAYCATFTGRISANTVLNCRNCYVYVHALDMCTILGPVAK